MSGALIELDFSAELDLSWMTDTGTSSQDTELHSLLRHSDWMSYRKTTNLDISVSITFVQNSLIKNLFLTKSNERKSNTVSGPSPSDIFWIFQKLAVGHFGGQNDKLVMDVPRIFFRDLRCEMTVFRLCPENGTPYEKFTGTKKTALDCAIVWWQHWGPTYTK